MKKAHASIFGVVIFLLITLPVIAQKMPAAESKVLPPSRELFRPAADLVSPWRDSGCPRFEKTRPLPGCYTVPEERLHEPSKMTIYEGNGSIWYAFNLNTGLAQQNAPNLQKGFLPYSASLRTPAYSVVLRMVAESEHWYEVEVNERTRATKYISKNDPAWARSTWDYWLTSYGSIYLPDDNRKLLNEPGGKVIEDYASLDFHKVAFLRSEGDWAFVEDQWGPEARRGVIYRGWLKWREGRDLLVGTYLNGYKAPGTQFREANLGIDMIPPPSAEKFRAAVSDLVTPWREMWCKTIFTGPECQATSIAEDPNASYMTIYDSGGKVWHEFDLGPYIARSPKIDREKGFYPFSAAQDMSQLFFRLVAESDHWYKVEVDEQSRATKYILKSDPTWAPTTWNYWLSYLNEVTIYPEQDQAILLDKPNGVPAEETEFMRFRYYNVERSEGDWAYVKGRANEQTWHGWIKWKDGRDILVRCYFTAGKKPEAKEILGENRKN